MNFDQMPSYENNEESPKVFEEFSGLERGALKAEKPKSQKVRKLMNAFIVGTYLLGASAGYVAVEAKPAAAKELTLNKEKREDLRLYISGTIQDKGSFEVYKTSYNSENDPEFKRAEKEAMNDPDMNKYFDLEEKAKIKSFKVFINGQEVHLSHFEVFSDGGSSKFTTDEGTLFVAHSAAYDIPPGKNDYEKVKSWFYSNDKKYPVQAEWHWE